MTTPVDRDPTPGGEPLGNDLLWTAVQYALGELPEEEAARFEARLEHDAAAQSALAEAVALEACVRLAEPSAPDADRVVLPAARNSWTRAAAWVIAATAASLALWFGLGRHSGDRPGTTAQHAPSDAQRELAIAWLAGQPEDDVVAIDLPVEEAEALEAETLPSIAEPIAPDWLIAALVEAQTSPLRGEN